MEGENAHENVERALRKKAVDAVVPKHQLLYQIANNENMN